MTTLNNLFKISYGQKQYHNKEGLEEGKTLLIASQGIDNGCYGFFDITAKYNPPIITVPSTGSIGEAFVQLIPCCVNDDCLVLIPRKKYTNEFLFYATAKVRTWKWRFNYGRKITPNRLGKLELKNPSEFVTSLDFKKLKNQITPKKRIVSHIDYEEEKKEFLLSEIFEINTGTYHSTANLKKGKIPLISCSENDNGIAGFYDIPLKNTYVNTITVAYDGRPLTAKYHNYRFAAYDNVGVLVPRLEFRNSTLLFITILLNIERWRYSYGRKCYCQKIQKLVIKLPVKNNLINEDYIEKTVKNTTYWSFLEKTT